MNIVVSALRIKVLLLKRIRFFSPQPSILLSSFWNSLNGVPDGYFQVVLTRDRSCWFYSDLSDHCVSLKEKKNIWFTSLYSISRFIFYIKFSFITKKYIKIIKFVYVYSSRYKEMYVIIL